MNYTEIIDAIKKIEDELILDLNAVGRVIQYIKRLDLESKEPVQQELQVYTPVSDTSMSRQYIKNFIREYFTHVRPDETFNYKSIQAYIETSNKVTMNSKEVMRLQSWLYEFKKFGILTVIRPRQYRQASMYKLSAKF